MLDLILWRLLGPPTVRIVGLGPNAQFRILGLRYVVSEKEMNSKSKIFSFKKKKAKFIIFIAIVKLLLPILQETSKGLPFVSFALTQFGN